MFSINTDLFLYNFTGQLLKSKENHENCLAGNVSIVQRNEYDNGARPIKSYVSVANNAEVQVSEMVYDEIGQVKAKKLHCNVDQSAQTLDYKYNIRGWLEKINDPLTLNNDMFAMELRYTSGHYPGYNGNISEIVWSSTQFKDVKKYTFQYDGLNRLLNSTYVGNGNFNECLTYDKNGNILTLARNGYTGNGFGVIDNLVYTYTGNQIKAINDDQNSINQNNGFTDNGFFSNQEYTHDVSGNLISDLNKQLSSIGYNHLNQPEKIEINASQPQIILNLYDAAGTKIKKETRVNQSVLNTTFYEGSFVYENDQLAYILMPEGRISLENNVYFYEYFIKDHLGNTRIVFNQFKSLLQDYSYYPFGMTMASLDYDKFNQSSINKLLYNGKEFQDEFDLNWYDYGARFYDPTIGKWWSVDPLTESYYRHSPYHFSGNNPMRLLDLNGMNYGDYYKTDGTHLGSDGIDDDKAYTATDVTKDDKGIVTDATDKNELSVTNSALVRLAAVSYGEGSTKDNFEEMAGISNVIVRQADARGQTLTDLLSSTGTFAYAASDGNARFKSFNNASVSDRSANAGMKTAMKGAINAVTGGTDYSNGAYFWDGADISTNYATHPKISAGFTVSEASHNIYNIKSSSVNVTTYWKNKSGTATSIRGTYTATYQSTAGHGGTIFSKYTDGFLKATGNKVYN